jgi:hypothetical protein
VGREHYRQHIQDQLDTPIDWVSVPEESWPEVHDHLSGHIHALVTEREKDEKSRKNAPPPNDNDAINDIQLHNLKVAMEEADKKDAAEARKKAAHQITLTEFMQFFNEINLKIARLDEKYEKMLEEESQANAEKRRELVKTKEQLKEAIKFEVNQQRILVEEMQKMNLA